MSDLAWLTVEMTVAISVIAVLSLLLLVFYRKSTVLAAKDQSTREKLDRLQLLSDEVTRLQASDIELRTELAALKSSLEAERAQSEKFERFWNGSQSDLAKANELLSDLRTQRATEQSKFDEREASYKAQLDQLKDAKEQLKKEFSNLATEVLEAKGRSFRELSEKSLTELLKPLHTDMKGFKDKVESIHTEETKQRTALQTELKMLQQLNQDITDKAQELSNALRGQKKIQGNWGELMLENVLESAGLRAGKDYERERAHNTHDGAVRRPDAIVYLPQGKHLIIDAKTSLEAYTQFVNADTDEQRESSLTAHATAVKHRIDELSNKQYFQLPDLNSPEVVIMFIPIESAYVEALKKDETLFQRAIERQVLVATPTTLLTSLNIVRQLWRFEDQSKHSAELANRAAKFYDKLRLFLESMSKVGKGIDSAKDHYDKALSQLSGGKANLIKQAAEFKDLGVSVTKELDSSVVETAKLELPQSDN